MRHLPGFDSDIFQRQLTVVDMKSDPSLHALTWDRAHTPKCLELLTECFEADTFIVGHQPQPEGCSAQHDRMIILASDHNHGCYVRFELGRPYSCSELHGMVKPLAGTGLEYFYKDLTMKSLVSKLLILVLLVSVLASCDRKEPQENLGSFDPALDGVAVRPMVAMDLERAERIKREGALIGTEDMLTEDDQAGAVPAPVSLPTAPPMGGVPATPAAPPSGGFAMPAPAAAPVPSWGGGDPNAF